MTVSSSEPALGRQRGHSPCSQPAAPHVLCRHLVCPLPGLPAAWQRFPGVRRPHPEVVGDPCLCQRAVQPAVPWVQGGQEACPAASVREVGSLPGTILSGHSSKEVAWRQG